MKKLFYLLLLTIGLSANAQKNVYVINLTTTNVDIGTINTKSTAISTYPHLSSNFLITVGPGQTYKLINPNPTYFPFYSPTSVPFITNWFMQSSSTTPFTSVASGSLNSSIAVNQVFLSVKFQVGPSGLYGGATLATGGSYTGGAGGFTWTATIQTSGAMTIITIQ